MLNARLSRYSTCGGMKAVEPLLSAAPRMKVCERTRLPFLPNTSLLPGRCVVWTPTGIGKVRGRRRRVGLRGRLRGRGENEGEAEAHFPSQTFCSLVPRKGANGQLTYLRRAETAPTWRTMRSDRRVGSALPKVPRRAAAL